jgi:hypothetical protein
MLKQYPIKLLEKQFIFINLKIENFINSLLNLNITINILVLCGLLKIRILKDGVWLIVKNLMLEKKIEDFC